MSGPELPRPLTDREIFAARPARNRVNPYEPYAYCVEEERTAKGQVEDVATIFLTNRECPFRCLMCDLWKNTLTQSVLPGEIPSQIEFALSRLRTAKHIKLYNSGNFFDRKAIPRSDHDKIAVQVSQFNTVIVENHPRFCNDECTRFRDSTTARLEVAIGLETAHEGVLERLNKQMTLADFERAAGFLKARDISVRAFILLRPPFLSESEGIEWADKSIQFAFSVGVDCCVIIPTRGGNGIMEQLRERGEFSPPTLTSMETALELGLGRGSRRRVFVDLWDAERFAPCPKCAPARIERLRTMNLTQELAPRIECTCEATL